MPRLEPGTAPREKQKDRLSLSTWRSRNSSKLAGGEHNPDSNSMDEAQRFEAWLLAERNAWSINKHRLPSDADDWLSGGAWSKRYLSKAEAGKLLGLAFMAIDAAGREGAE